MMAKCAFRTAVLLIAGFVSANNLPQVQAQLRIVTYNTFTAQASGGVQTARLPYSSIVFDAIGDENVGGIAKPIDILLLQEQYSMELTTQSFADVLNDLYDPIDQTMYARSTVNGLTSSDFAPDPFKGTGGRPGVVYNTESVQLLGEFTLGNVGSGSNQQPRATLLYHFRPVGYDSSADFYIYNSHYKAETGATENSRRLAEAQTIRASSDIAPEGTHIIYAGDYNIQASSAESYQYLLSSGNGQAFDPINMPGIWTSNTAFTGIHTQSPASTDDKLPGGAGGGVDDRFDFQLVTGEFLDNEGLSYIPGSYHTFGNNGTHGCCNNSITNGMGASSTVLNALLNNSDHLPVVADYQLPAKMDAVLGLVPTNVSFGSLVPIDVMVENIADVLTANGADELDYTINVSGSLLGGVSDSAFPLAGAVAHQIYLDTSTSGFHTGVVTVTSDSQQAANSMLTFPISFTVGGGSGGPVFGVVAKDTFDENMNLLSFDQNPADDAVGTDPQDGFGVYQVGVSSSIPNALRDDSNNGLSIDALGVVDTAVKTDRWFGINDLENSDNPVGTGTVTWSFDITGAFDLQVSVDMAAMGDFEPEDVYNWTYQIDSGSVLPLFTSSIDDEGTYTYYMADGDPVTLNDPLYVTDAQGSVVQLTNEFQTLTSQLAGLGDVLHVYLNVANNADEPFAFDNIVVEGTTFVGFLAADFNQDGNVDDRDLAEWQAAYGRTEAGDADADGDTDGADFLVWLRQFGTSTAGSVASSNAIVPEPAGLCLGLASGAFLGFVTLSRKRWGRGVKSRDRKQRIPSPPLRGKGDTLETR